MIGRAGIGTRVDRRERRFATGLSLTPADFLPDFARPRVTVALARGLPEALWAPARDAGVGAAADRRAAADGAFRFAGFRERDCA